MDPLPDEPGSPAEEDLEMFDDIDVDIASASSSEPASTGTPSLSASSPQESEQASPPGTPSSEVFTASSYTDVSAIPPDSPPMQVEQDPPPATPYSGDSPTSTLTYGSVDLVAFPPMEAEQVPVPATPHSGDSPTSTETVDPPVSPQIQAAQTPPQANPHPGDSRTFTQTVDPPVTPLLPLLPFEELVAPANPANLQAPVPRVNGGIPIAALLVSPNDPGVANRVGTLAPLVLLASVAQDSIGNSGARAPTPSGDAHIERAAFVPATSPSSRGSRIIGRSGALRSRRLRAQPSIQRSNQQARRIPIPAQVPTRIVLMRARGGYRTIRPLTEKSRRGMRGVADQLLSFNETRRDEDGS